MALLTLSASAEGATDPVRLPMGTPAAPPPIISLLVNFSGGGPAVATATVEISNDPLALSDPTSARWNPHDVLVSITDDTNSTLIAPILAVRLNLVAYTSGTVTLDIGVPG